MLASSSLAESETRPSLLEAPLFPREAERVAQRLVTRAIAENRLVAAFQPVVRADAPGMVAFHEALVRVLDADGGIVPAGSFIPVLEAGEVGRVIDRAMLRRALSGIGSPARRRISVNISALTVGDVDWLAILRSAVERQPDIGMFLIVEITETAMLDLNHRALDFLYELRELGCSIAVDDFGAGYSSIGHLGKFRFDFLKIDGHLVRDIASNPQHRRTVAALLAMARHFDLMTVAEMVEREEDIALLRDMGVDCVQGWAVGRPEIEPAWREE